MWAIQRVEKSTPAKEDIASTRGWNRMGNHIDETQIMVEIDGEYVPLVVGDLDIETIRENVPDAFKGDVLQFDTIVKMPRRMTAMFCGLLSKSEHKMRRKKLRKMRRYDRRFKRTQKCLRNNLTT